MTLAVVMGAVGFGCGLLPQDPRLARCPPGAIRSTATVDHASDYREAVPGLVAPELDRMDVPAFFAIYEGEVSVSAFGGRPRGGTTPQPGGGYLVKRTGVVCAVIGDDVTIYTDVVTD